MKGSVCNDLSQGLKEKTLLDKSPSSVRFAVAMTQKMKYPFTILSILLLLCSVTVSEIPIQLLRLSGPLADRESEISGLAWKGDHLIFCQRTRNGFRWVNTALSFISHAQNWSRL